MPIPRKTIVSDLLIRKLDAVEVKDGRGRFRGYAAVWGDQPDKKGDIVERGAFAQALVEWKDRGTMPRVKWRHRLTVGHVTAMSEDDHGLLVEGQIWDADVVEALAEAKDAGEAIGMSFGFWPAEGGSRTENGVRYLSRVVLDDDITITISPVNPSAELLEVKGDDAGSPGPAVLEGVLRDAGLSRKQAKGVLARGLSSLREAAVPPSIVQGLGEIAAMLRRA